MNVPVSGEPAPAPWKACFAAATLVVLVLAAYVPAFQAGYIWDDDEWLVYNADVRSAEGLERIWLRPTEGPHYYPLVFTTFWIEYHLWGYEPAGYHIVNVLLHALKAVLVWLVLKRLNVPAAWFGAALFALHPVNVESVAWVTERKNVLSLCMALAALLAYLRFHPLEAAEAGRPRAWHWYVLALFLYSLASASKTVVVTLPPTILVLIWWKRGRLALREVLELAPWLAIGVFFALQTMRAEAPKIAFLSDLIQLQPLDRLVVAGRSAWFYFSKLLWPHPLTAVYPRFQVDAAAAPGLLLYPCMLLLALGLLWWRRKDWGRGPLAAALIFGGALFPVLGFFNHSTMSMTFVADHYVYHASVALLALCAACANRLLAAGGPHLLRLGGLAGTGVLAALGALCFAHGLRFAGQEALWTQNLQHNQDSWPAHYNLAAEATRAGRYDEALAHYTEAIRVRPNDASNYNNLAFVRLKQGKLELAVEQFTRARELRPKDAEIRSNLGQTLARLGRLAEAQAELENAVALRPGFALAHEGLGRVLARLGKLDEAAAQFQLALDTQPDFAAAHFGLGDVLYRQKHFEAAAGRFAEALRLQPGYQRAIYGLGRSFEHLGRPSDAAACYRAMLELEPGHPDATRRLKQLDAGGTQGGPGEPGE